ncbi:unnamed protein product [Parascedosporium putredinis]|uniref:Uncharacterized protein n=1 Tax=Parascedosporium putredinis TaxID=1442378 RepID=A0A9P1M7I7_9PEZI|nr:unnamed protein product [Parascedosporium putredinis]CAI7990588.1 unnamed protein product [Parascedosporium putredinis]
MKPLLFACFAASASAAIDRLAVVRAFNPERTASSDETPLQVGNGNFAFGADITGLQTFKPFASMSTWAWHSFALPKAENQTSPEDFRGVEWDTHGRPVAYNQPNEEQPELSNWLRENPHRLNLDHCRSQLRHHRRHHRLDLLASGDLFLFLDFPYPTKDKFNAPFVGVYNQTDLHSTDLVESSDSAAEVRHTLDEAEYSVFLRWEGNATVSAPEDGSHRYFLRTEGGGSGSVLKLTVTFAERDVFAESVPPSVINIAEEAEIWWGNFWQGGAFVDLTATDAEDAWELQKRVVLSQYLIAVNSASDLPPQESGLVNNGWFGKFHQPHPMYFAELERRRAAAVSPEEEAVVLAKWDDILSITADFMASFAWWNETSEFYDLGAPMYPASENTDPKVTRNPTFELAYWRFGLDIAIQWKEHLAVPAPDEWIDVRDFLAPLPIVDGTFPVYEGIPDMWLDLDAVRRTAEHIKEFWDLDQSFGWDFPMLAMNSLRLGEVADAVEYLLHPTFAFDDAGYPIGGTRVPTPYFPSSSSLLVAVAMMAGGWEGAEGPISPKRGKQSLQGLALLCEA